MCLLKLQVTGRCLRASHYRFRFAAEKMLAQQLLDATMSAATTMASSDADHKVPTQTHTHRARAHTVPCPPPATDSRHRYRHRYRSHSPTTRDTKIDDTTPHLTVDSTHNDHRARHGRAIAPRAPAHAACRRTSRTPYESLPREGGRQPASLSRPAAPTHAALRLDTL